MTKLKGIIIVTHVLHQAGDSWRDLCSPILQRINTGLPVSWMSFSGTVQILASSDGLLTRTRSSKGSPLPGDGWPLLVESPFFATACGCGDASGYRSTPPLLVVALESVDDVNVVIGTFGERVRRLIESGFEADAVPEGHPQTACGARYCPITALT